MRVKMIIRAAITASTLAGQHLLFNGIGFTPQGCHRRAVPGSGAQRPEALLAPGHQVDHQGQ